jgi:Ca2+-binding RTX toxin-like protein
VPSGVAVVRRTLTYRGGARANVVDVVKVGRSFILTQGEGHLAVGPGCRRLVPRSAKCSAARIRSFFANGGAGDDSVAATISLPSTLLGGTGSDRLEGGTAGDLVSGGPGEDTLDGGAGADLLVGDGTDVLLGGEGADALLREAGGAGGVMEGGPGNDLLQGNEGDDDNVLGGDGDDYINGLGGNDRMFGGGGADILIAGSGDDTLSGRNAPTEPTGMSDGTDLLYCGAGTDRADPLDATQRLDGTTCELFGLVGGVGGGYPAIVLKKLIRPVGGKWYVLVRVLSRAQVDRCKVNVKLLTATGRVVAQGSQEVKGGWRRLDIVVPRSVRRVEAAVAAC